MQRRLEWLVLVCLLGTPAAWAHPVRVPHSGQWQDREDRWRHLSPERRKQILQAQRRFEQLPKNDQQRLWAEYRQRQLKREQGRLPSSGP